MADYFSEHLKRVEYIYREHGHLPCYLSRAEKSNDTGASSSNAQPRKESKAAGTGLEFVDIGLNLTGINKVRKKDYKYSKMETKMSNLHLTFFYLSNFIFL